MIAWVGAAPTGNRKRAVSAVEAEHMDQPSKKVKSTPSAASKPIKPTATRRGQSILKIMLLVTNSLYTDYY